MEQTFQTLALGGQVATIEAGELVSYRVDGHEFMHQKGSPGWRSTDTEMFPVIGPTAEADFLVWTPCGSAPQDQHGLLREMPYQQLTSGPTLVVYDKSYRAGQQVSNSKWPAKSSIEWLTWPYAFRFRKTFELREEGLEVSFHVTGDEAGQFMLGYHPAFRLVTAQPTIEAGSRKITLPEVLAVGSRALELANCTEVILHDERGLRISTQGFGHFMCWTEVTNMVCIEPITFYPYGVAQQELGRHMQSVGNGQYFHVRLEPR